MGGTEPSYIPIMLMLVLGRARESQSTGSCFTIPTAPVSASSHCPPNTARAGLGSMPAWIVHPYLHLQHISSGSLKTLPPDFPFCVFYLFPQRAPLPLFLIRSNTRSEPSQLPETPTSVTAFPFPQTDLQGLPG